MRTFNEYLKESLEDVQFAKAYEEISAEVDLGIALARQRETLGLTQQQVSEMTGIKQPMLARIEGGQMPKAATLKKLAKALNVGILFSGDGIGVIKIETIALGALAQWAIERLRDTTAAKIPIGNVVDIEAYRRKKKPLTIERQNNEVNYENIKSVVG